ncbi:MAG: holo-ACP synthase [Patescibacteria group bacterium]
MQFKIGIDLIEVKRFENIAEKTRFLVNNFTKKELKDCKKRQIESLAGKFAAKEAVRKTIKENVKFNAIEIINNKDGSPCVNFLDKKIKEKYESEISITHTKFMAQAVCITFKK